MAETKPRLKVESDADLSSDAAAGGAPTSGADTRPADEAPAASEGAQASAKGGENPFANARKITFSWLKNNFPGHENAAFGGLCGLVVAILVFLIGFWRTLFIVICVLVGVAIGQYLDGNPTVVKAVRKLFGNGSEQ